MSLGRIVQATRERLGGKGCQRPLAEMEALAEAAPPVRDFEAALRGVPFALIAEIKRASPSKGWLRRELDAAGLARSYERGGAAALSVLTEPVFFKGGLEDLVQSRAATSLPVLRKDFILDPRQVYEARLYGADAVLLIAALLPPGELKELASLCHGLGMAALVEVHTEAEVGAALEAGARLVGINNRNLEDFTVDPGTTFRLLPLIPAGVTVVSESGISSAEDIRRLRAAGVRACLVGEALVTTPDPEARVRELLGETGILKEGEVGRGKAPSDALRPPLPGGRGG